MQQSYGLSAVAVASITVAKLWTRPIGAVAAGFVGDKFNRERVLAGLMLAGTIALAGLIALPLDASIGALLDRYPGKPGYSLYFGGIVLMGLLGTLSAWRLNVIVSKRAS